MLVYAIGLTTRFRRITVREGMLVEGPAGWGEFCPFTEYDDAECVPWLAAAVEAAQEGWPAPVRERVPVNAIVPAVSPERRVRAGQGVGLRYGEGEGGRRARLARPPTSSGWRPSGTRSGRAARCGWTPTRRGTVDEAVTAIRALDARRGRAGVRRAAVPDGRGARGRAAAGGRADRRRRVDPPRRGPAAGGRGRGGRRRRAQVRAARRGAAGARGGRGVRAAVRRVLGAADERRAGGGDRAGRGAAGAAVRVRAGHRRAVHRRRGGRTRSCRGTAGSRCPAARPPPCRDPAWAAPATGPRGGRRAMPAWPRSRPPPSDRRARCGRGQIWPRFAPNR